ncbi:hypothetical protein [Devosia naphthalenivorans]|uniref:hypothetical protein n=1 Tax=Devosia naphthalenivorans TaxID=2082392 RepID=UPI000D35D28D|nr:hypothetical protein [Devosia naphthalenivorans]
MSEVDFRALRATNAWRAKCDLLEDIQLEIPAVDLVKTELERVQTQIRTRYDSTQPWSPSNRAPVKGVIIFGRSGSTITRSLQTALGALKPVDLGDGHFIDPKTTMMDAPDYGTTAAMSRDIINWVGGGKMVREPDNREANRKVLSKMTNAQLTVFAIDRMHRLLNPDRHSVKGYRAETHMFWEQMIAIMSNPDWSTPLALAGSEVMLTSLDMEDPIDKRRRVREEAFGKFSRVRLPDLTMSDDTFIIDTVQKYCITLGIHIVNDLFAADLARRIVHASGYAYGHAIVLAREACALAAVRPSSKGLKASDFENTYAAWTSCGVDANPLNSPHWANIDTTRIAPRTFEEAKHRPRDSA